MKHSGPLPFVPVDGRQSEIAADIQRGVARLLHTLDFSTVTELPLQGGRRADLVALSKTADIWIVEIKSSVEDFRADNKWHDYWDHCDRLFFAVMADFPTDILPEGAGLIVADKFGGEIIRESPEQKLNGGRRKAVTIRFARAAARRLHALHDPSLDVIL